MKAAKVAKDRNGVCGKGAARLPAPVKGTVVQETDAGNALWRARFHPRRSEASPGTDTIIADTIIAF